MRQKPDIFDCILSARILSPVQPLYLRHKELLLYLFFGGLTTVLSIGLFWVFTKPMHISVLIGNVLGWIVCVLFAYLTNRTWVFQDKAHDTKGILMECGTFFLGRIGTLVMEELVLWGGIEQMRFNSMGVKVFAQVLVVAGNYIISKWMMFTNRA